MDVTGAAETIIKSLTNHAFRLLEIKNLKVLMIIENDEGDRFWAGNGRLKNEFVNEGKVEHRSWGMFEVKENQIVISTKPAGKRSVTPSVVESPPVKTAKKEGAGVKEKGVKEKGAQQEANVICYICQTPGHKANACPNNKKKTKASQQARATQAKVVVDANNGPSPTVCYRCGESGHVRRNCPKQWSDCASNDKSKPTMDKDVRCHWCGADGHVKIDCPQLGRSASSSTTAAASSTAASSASNANDSVMADPSPRAMNIRTAQWLKCHCCGADGHESSDCPQLLLGASSTASISSSTFNVEDSVEGDSSLSSSKECRYCHAIGHWKANCPLLKAKVSSLCYYCKETGHQMRDCAGAAAASRMNVNGKSDSYDAVDPPPASSSMDLDNLTIPIICTCCHLLGHAAHECPLKDDVDHQERERRDASNDNNVSPKMMPPPDASDDKALTDVLKKLRVEEKIRYTWLAREKKFLVSVPNGKNDELLRIDSKRQLLDALAERGFLV